MAMTRGEAARRLPWPAEWRSRRPKPLALVSFLGLLSVGLPAIGIMAVVRQDYGVGILLLLGSPTLFTVTALGYLTRTRGRRRGVRSIRSSYVSEIEEQAVLIPYSRVLGVVAWALLLALIVFCIPLILVSALIGIEESGPGAIVYLVFSSSVTLYALVLIAEIIRGNFARGKLALTTTGVYHRSWAFSSLDSWENLFSVSADEFEGPVIWIGVFDNRKPHFRRTSRFWKQAEFRLAPFIVIKTTYLSVDPALAYYALRFYHEHPEARSELGTAAGVERLRRGDVLG